MSLMQLCCKSIACAVGQDAKAVHICICPFVYRMRQGLDPGFRVLLRRAVINRYGFNSDGVDAVGERLAGFRQRAAAEPWRAPGLVAVNLGKNKTSEDAAADYAIGVSKLGKHADFLVINVSSPNTQGVRTQPLALKVIH